MADEIEKDDWIEWPGTAGPQRGKVGNVDSEVYDVRVKAGDSWVTTTVPKGDRVRKVDPPPDEE